MSLIPCDSCAKRVQEKLSQCTWAWYDAKGTRMAFRVRLCTACYVTYVLPFDKPLDYEALSCPGCGISTEHDMLPMYATVYLPGHGKEQFEFPTCGACAVIIQQHASEHGTRLENRERVEGPGSGPSTQTDRESYWATIAVRGNLPDDAV